MACLMLLDVYTVCFFFLIKLTVRRYTTKRWWTSEQTSASLLRCFCLLRFYLTTILYLIRFDHVWLSLGGVGELYCLRGLVVSYGSFTTLYITFIKLRRL